MEGVGARLGRSSTRYGPATVFSGPVRKWKKRWIHVSPLSNNNNNSSNHSNQNHNHGIINSNNSNSGGSTVNGNNGSHLLLYKWTPLSRRDSNGDNNNSNAEKSPANDDSKLEDPPRRKFKYIPIAVLEEQKRIAETEPVEDAENEEKPIDADPNAADPAAKSDNFDEKPDINDVPMEENQDDDQKVVRQDLNESTLDLSLGLNSHDGDSDSKTEQTPQGTLERVNSSSVGT